MKIKIIFVLPSLRAGGAERVMSFIACHLNKDNFTTSLLITGSNIDQAYKIGSETPITFLNKSAVRYALPSLALHIIRQKPNIVIGSIAHVNLVLAILAIFFRRTKFVGRETIVPSGKIYVGSKKVKKHLFPDPRPLFLDKIICQSEDMKRDLAMNFKFPETKLVVINNPVSQKFQQKDNYQKNNVFQLITIGRLTKQKGHLRILSVLSKLAIPFKYTILGHGPEEENIFDYAKKLNLLQHITHIPFTDKVEDYLAKSDLLLSGSYVEGFPNVFLESCAVGTPVLAFNALGGINEIIVEGINGWVATDESDFLTKLDKSFHMPWDPGKIRETVIRRYSQKIILKKYEDLFQSL